MRFIVVWCPPSPAQPAGSRSWRLKQPIIYAGRPSTWPVGRGWADAWSTPVISRTRPSGQTGLTDFGADSFDEGLTILLNSLERQARLNARGEAFIYGRITGYLAQRLQVEDWYRRHPEIDDGPILAPVIGLGLPRTGSTALSMLWAQDPDIRYLRRWESSQPCPPPSTVVGCGSPSPTRQRGDDRHPVPRAHRHPCADGMPRTDGAGFHIAHLPVVRAGSGVLCSGWSKRRTSQRRWPTSDG